MRISKSMMTPLAVVVYTVLKKSPWVRHVLETEPTAVVAD